MTDWDDLRYFLAIWRAGSMAGAATALKVNQTTVGRRLGALEERLGALLFDRSPTGLRVTDAGKKIATIASQMEESALALERLVAGADDKLDGCVRIACSETLAVGFVIGQFASFRERYPSIALELAIGNAPLNLVRREADLAIRTMKPPQGELVVRKLVDASWRLYASAKLPVGSDEPAALESHPIVGLEGELANIGPSQWLHQRVPPDRIATRCGAILGAAVAIRAGLGVGPLPAFLADGDPELRRFGEETITVQPLWLVVHPDLQGQARVRAAIDFLVQAFADAQPRFSG